MKAPKATHLNQKLLISPKVGNLLTVFHWNSSLNIFMTDQGHLYLETNGVVAPKARFGLFSNIKIEVDKIKTDKNTEFSFVTEIHYVKSTTSISPFCSKSFGIGLLDHPDKFDLA